MQLLVAHQILIGSAIALAALFGVRALVLFLRGDGYLDLYLALSSAAVFAALILYFRKIRARWRASREKLSPRRTT
jgi:hypothetical protein